MGSNRLSRHRSLGSYLNYLDEKSKYSEYRTDYSSVIAANSIGESSLAEELAIVQKAIQSGNYIAGEAGWRITGDGDAEFGSVVVRGDITAYSGAIGYWNISSPAVTRVIGTTRLLGTFLESAGIGDNDDSVISGTYVGLFKSYSPDPFDVSRKSRSNNVATLTILDHDLVIGDYIIVSLEDDTSFNSNGEKVQIIDMDYQTISFSNTGSDVSDSESVGYVYFYNKDVAGLYLRDYSKSEFDYGYFSNTGIAYVSAEDLNLVENPSFEYLGFGKTPQSSSASWSAGTGITFSLEQFNDNTDPQYQFDSSYGGKAIWSSALSTYLTGKLDYAAGNQYNFYNFGRVFYFGLTIFPSFTSTRSVPTGVSRYVNGSSLYWKVDTGTAHGLSAGDTALLDFEGKQYDGTYSEWNDYMPKSVTGGTTRTYTVLASPAPTSTSFYVDSGHSSTEKLGDGVTLINVVIIDPVNTNQIDFPLDPYGTRPGAYVYKVLNAAFSMSDIRLRFGNGSTVNLYDVLSVETQALWTTDANKYYTLDPTLFALGYHNPAIGIPYMSKLAPIIIDANKLAIKYKILDSSSYNSQADILIDIPGWMYYHNGTGYVSGSPTKINSAGYVLDNVYLSTTNKSFFGGSLANSRWYSTTDLVPSYDPAQASIEGTKQWINVDLDTQTAYLDYFDYVGFKQSNFSRSMLIPPSITTSDSNPSKIVKPTDYETISMSGGTYRYINNVGSYVDLYSSIKSTAGDRNTGFELIASKKYYTGLSDYLFAEDYAIIAGYWDEASTSSIVKIGARKFVVSGAGTSDYNNDRLTVDVYGVVINGNLTVNGYTTTINSTTITVDDKNIELASTASPSDALADGAGLTVKATGDKTWIWVNGTNAWTANQNIEIVSTGTSYRIAGSSVLNATTLGSGVVNSSLTKVGALSSGTAGFVKVDASGNLTSTSSSSSMATLMGYTSTVTSGTPVVLTSTSTYYQQFTGSTAQTITLPVTSTLALGWTFHIVNNNTPSGNLTVNSSGGNLVITVPPGTTAMVTCIATAGTGATNWEAGLTDFSTYTGTGNVVLSSAPTLSSPVISTITNTGTLTLPTTTGYLALNPTTAKGDIIYASAAGTPGTLAALAIPPTNGHVLTYDSATGLPKWAAPAASGGTVTSIGITVPTGLSVTPSSITTSGTFAVTYATGYAIPTTASQTNWDTAYTDRNNWDGGSTGLVASTGRTSLGATTVGSNLFTLTNPTAVTFLRINADNTVSTLDAATFRTAIGAGTSSTTGTVTSVGLSLPTGLSVTPSSITTSGTFAVTYSVGYAIPTTSDVGNGVTAYGWGNHASAGYLTTSAAASTYQPLDTDLTAIAALTGVSGFLKTNGAGTWSVDNSTYLTSLGIGSSTQAWDADLDAISAISTTGILKRTGTSTWVTITDNSANWNTAYGWGNHASAGYLTSSSGVTTVNGSSGAIGATANSNGAVTKYYRTTNSAGTTTTINHALGQWVICQVFKTSDGTMVDVDVANTATSGGTTTVTFFASQTAGDYTIVIIG